MRIAQRVDERPGAVPAHLGEHHRQQRIARDVEWDPEEDVRRSLVELAAEAVRAAVLHGLDRELEQAVARGQRHLVDLPDVPRTHQMPPAAGIVGQPVEQQPDLIDLPPVRRGPGPPLLAIDRPQFAVLARPFVPDPHTHFVERPGVRVPSQEPQKLVDDRAQMELLGRYERESRFRRGGSKRPVRVRQVVPCLVTEDAERPGPGPVLLAGTLVENPSQQVVVFTHNRSVSRPDQSAASPSAPGWASFPRNTQSPSNAAGSSATRLSTRSDGTQFIARSADRPPSSSRSMPTE